MSRRYDIVISDIDGCLSPEQPTAFDTAALLRIAEYNHASVRDVDRPILTVCTGRPLPFAEAMCRLLGNMTAPCVAENGVWLYHPGRNEYRMDPAISEDDVAAVHDAEAYARRMYGPRGFTIQPGKAASLSLYHPNPEALHALAPEIEEATRSRGWPLRISTTWLYINCDLVQISKGSGIRRLIEAVGVDRGRLAGIGDTLGDRFIQDSVGWFACPANADPRLAEQADYVSAHAEVHGVIDILERLRG